MFYIFSKQIVKACFNVILKLNNHTLKKTIKLFFIGKNEAQISGFAVAKKPPSP